VTPELAHIRNLKIGFVHRTIPPLASVECANVMLPMVYGVNATLDDAQRQP